MMHYRNSCGNRAVPLGGAFVSWRSLSSLPAASLSIRCHYFSALVSFSALTLVVVALGATGHNSLFQFFQP
jgi:hypothetical protein